MLLQSLTTFMQYNLMIRRLLLPREFKEFVKEIVNRLGAERC